MRGFPQELNDISECRLKIRGVIVILLLTAVYFTSYFFMPEKILFLLIAGTALITLFFVRPEPGFWLLLLPLVFMSGGLTLSMGEFEPAVATVVMAMFAFFYTADRILRNKTLFIPSPFLFFIFIGFLIQVFSIFISIHLHGQHLWNAIREGSSFFLFFPLAIVIPVLCRTDDKLNQLLRAVLIAVLIASVIGVIQYFSITSFSRVDMSLGYVYKGRIASLFGNSNIFAGYLELGIPPAIALFFLEKNIKWKITAAAAVAFGILSVLYTFSRGGLICTFIGCGITLLYVFRSKIWIPVILGVLSIFILIMSADTFERQMSFFMNPEAHLNQPTILHRYITYSGFFDQIAESPVTGVGWGAREFFWGRSPIYTFWEVRHAVSVETIRTFGGLNNLFLNQAVKGGIVSVISALIVFAAIFAAFFRAFKRGRGIVAIALIAGISSFLLHQFLDNLIRFPTVNAQFWTVSGLLLALAASGSKISDKDKQES